MPARIGDRIVIVQKNGKIRRKIDGFEIKRGKYFMLISYKAPVRHWWDDSVPPPMKTHNLKLSMEDEQWRMDPQCYNEKVLAFKKKQNIALNASQEGEAMYKKVVGSSGKRPKVKEPIKTRRVKVNEEGCKIKNFRKAWDFNDNELFGALKQVPTEIGTMDGVKEMKQSYGHAKRERENTGNHELLEAPNKHHRKIRLAYLLNQQPVKASPHYVERKLKRSEEAQKKWNKELVENILSKREDYRPIKKRYKGLKSDGLIYVVENLENVEECEEAEEEEEEKEKKEEKKEEKKVAPKSKRAVKPKKEENEDVIVAPQPGATMKDPTNITTLNPGTFKKIKKLKDLDKPKDIFIDQVLPPEMTGIFIESETDIEEFEKQWSLAARSYWDSGENGSVETVENPGNFTPSEISDLYDSDLSRCFGDLYEGDDYDYVVYPWDDDHLSQIKENVYYDDNTTDQHLSSVVYFEEEEFDENDIWKKSEQDNIYDIKLNEESEVNDETDMNEITERTASIFFSDENYNNDEKENDFKLDTNGENKSYDFELNEETKAEVGIELDQITQRNTAIFFSDENLQNTKFNIFYSED